ncbi:MAG: type II secretion system protein GspM [Cellvibrionales bacterium]|nr:type II secretion system protein GspM [Cellvibrionales bacterium]
MKNWFMSLDLRERNLLMFGGTAGVLLILLSMLLSVHDEKAKQERFVGQGVEKMEWVADAVQTLKSAKGGGVDPQFRGKSLIQVSELAANRSGIRSTRFQPGGGNDAQIWFEEVPFSALMQYISRLEQDFGVIVESVSINSAKTIGLVNARVKFSK